MVSRRIVSVWNSLPEKVILADRIQQTLSN